MLRNIGIVAHIDAGKTTLTERILYRTGAQAWVGEVEDGTSAMDYLADEQARGISIGAAATKVHWHDHAIHVVDTPGHVDFTAEVERCLRVVDGVLVVLDGTRGVESQTETVWRQADAWLLPRIVFVNKMDRPEADFDASVISLEERLEAQALPVVLPLRAQGRWVGNVDVVTGTLRLHDSEAAQESDAWFELAEPLRLEARERLVEACAETDEEILAAFVEGQSVDDDTLWASLSHACRAGRIVPVFAGAALPGRGLFDLLDGICRLLPSPAERAADLRAMAAGGALDADRLMPIPDVDKPMSALAFKLQADPQDDSKMLCFVRVYTGELRPGHVVAVAARELEWGVDALFEVRGVERVEISSAGPGQIVAFHPPEAVLRRGMGRAAGLRTGDTLHAPGRPCDLLPVRFPRPVVEASVEPLTEADREAVERAAERLAFADPTLELHENSDSGGLLIAGMGELHLDVFRAQLDRATGGRVRLSAPRAALVETVERRGRGVAEVHALDARASVENAVDGDTSERSPDSDGAAPQSVSAGAVDQTEAGGSRARVVGGSGGRPRLRVVAEVIVEPLSMQSDGGRVEQRGIAAVTPAQAVVEGCDLPGTWSDELCIAIERRARIGLHAPCPAVDLRVRVLALRGPDPGHAPAPDDPLWGQAVWVALEKAFADAGGGKLLAPWVQFEMHCPQDVLSGTLADLGTRDARLDTVASGSLGARVLGRAPLLRMLGYSAELRHRSRGLGEVVMQPAGYFPQGESPVSGG